jgi:hypothetical protein
MEKHRLIMYKNRVMRENIWTNREEVAGDYGKVQNEERHNLHSSPHIINTIKLRRMR